jgi:hypothetical protein
MCVCVGSQHRYFQETNPPPQHHTHTHNTTHTFSQRSRLSRGKHPWHALDKTQDRHTHRADRWAEEDVESEAPASPILLVLRSAKGHSHTEKKDNSPEPRANTLRPYTSTSSKNGHANTTHLLVLSSASGAGRVLALSLFGCKQLLHL